jgi:methyl coenzyme M reductase subunit D
MPANTELWKAHDIAQKLQDQIEVLPRVERAFVHVDHESTHIPVGPSSGHTVQLIRFLPQEHRKEK